MVKDTQSKVYEFIQKKGTVSVRTIKQELKIKERNAVEQVVLGGLNSGKLELTAKGVKVRA